MTVGIASICEENQTGKVVLAADRMITTGRNPRIEYEHTKSKIQTINDDDVVAAMAIASGTVTLIEEFFHRLNDKIDEPTTVRDIARTGREVYTKLGKDTVQHERLDKLGIELDDLANNQDQFDQNVLSSLLGDVNDAQQEFASQLEVLIGGVDGMGCHLFSIQAFDMNPHNTIGYHAIGSGTQPARSVFIRNEHETSCDLTTAVINTIEAKHRSEEARGVGTEMDLAIVEMPQEGSDNCRMLEDEKDGWVDLYDEIVEAEREAREQTISEETEDTQ